MAVVTCNVEKVTAAALREERGVPCPADKPILLPATWEQFVALLRSRLRLPGDTPLVIVDEDSGTTVNAISSLSHGDRLTVSCPEWVAARPGAKRPAPAPPEDERPSQRQHLTAPAPAAEAAPAAAAVASTSAAAPQQPPRRSRKPSSESMILRVRRALDQLHTECPESFELGFEPKQIAQRIARDTPEGERKPTPSEVRRVFGQKFAPIHIGFERVGGANRDAYVLRSRRADQRQAQLMLQYAIVDGDENKVAAVLDENEALSFDTYIMPAQASWSAVEAGPIEGFSPLHVAAYYGKAGALRLLMARAEAALTRAAANVAAASLEDDASARRASFWAQRTARSPTALDALALGELPGVPEADGPLKYRYHVGQGASFLHLACYSGSAECVRLLLEHAETDVNAQTDNGMTPITCIASAKIASLLLAHPRIAPDVLNERWSAFSAYHRAALRGEANLLRVFLEFPTLRVDEREPIEGWTALHLVRCPRTLAVLLECPQVDEETCDAASDAGLTPLTHAIHRLTCVESENEKAAALECSLMLLRSEKVDKRNSVNGYNVLHALAGCNEYFETLSAALIERDVDALIEERMENNGITPLLMAAKHGNAAAIDFFVANNGRVNVLAEDDNTSLHYVMGHLASELANFDDLADPGFKKAVANGMAALQAILDDCGAGGIVVYENEDNESAFSAALALMAPHANESSYQSQELASDWEADPVNVVGARVAALAIDRIARVDCSDQLPYPVRAALRLCRLFEMRVLEHLSDVAEEGEGSSRFSIREVLVHCDRMRALAYALRQAAADRAAKREGAPALAISRKDLGTLFAALARPMCTLERALAASEGKQAAAARQGAAAAAAVGTVGTPQGTPAPAGAANSTLQPWGSTFASTAQFRSPAVAAAASGRAAAQHQQPASAAPPSVSGAASDRFHRRQWDASSELDRMEGHEDWDDEDWDAAALENAAEQAALGLGEDAYPEVAEAVGASLASAVGPLVNALFEFAKLAESPKEDTRWSTVPPWVREAKAREAAAAKKAAAAASAAAAGAAPAAAAAPECDAFADRGECGADGAASAPAEKAAAGPVSAGANPVPPVGSARRPQTRSRTAMEAAARAMRTPATPAVTAPLAVAATRRVAAATPLTAAADPALLSAAAAAVSSAAGTPPFAAASTPAASAEAQLPAAAGQASEGEAASADDGEPAFDRFVRAFARRFPRVVNAALKGDESLIEHCLSPLWAAPDPKAPSALLPLSTRHRLLQYMARPANVDEYADEVSVMRLTVRREDVFEHSICNADHFSEPMLRDNLLRVEFDGEPGIDGGGLTREWLTLLLARVFDPDANLFQQAGGPDPRIVVPSPAAGLTDPDGYLEKLRFAGTLVGMALRLGLATGRRFPLSLYRRLLGLDSVSMADLAADLAATRPDVYRTLHSPPFTAAAAGGAGGAGGCDFTVEDLDLTFVATVERLKGSGVVETVELRPGGTEVGVTEANKAEFRSRLTWYLCLSLGREEREAFVEGFRGVVPVGFVSAFTPAELGDLICGSQGVDVGDLRAAVECGGGFTEASPQVGWFWEVVGEMTQAELSRLLFFWHAAEAPPAGGLRGLRSWDGSPAPLRLIPAPGGAAAGVDGAYPTAHTCSNTLVLPEYTSKEVLRERLLGALKEAGCGGFMMV